MHGRYSVAASSYDSVVVGEVSVEFSSGTFECLSSEQ
eukprot:SAG31_NODE_28027_length_416_cov_1.141956_1_plen_36_part_10